MHRKFVKFASAVIALLLCAHAAIGQTTAPSITLRAPATLASQTSQTSVPLLGSATSQSEIKNIVWVNQSGNRGKASWTAGAKSTSWQIDNLPLRAGPAKLPRPVARVGF